MINDTSGSTKTSESIRFEGISSLMSVLEIDPPESRIPDQSRPDHSLALGADVLIGKISIDFNF